MSMDYLDLIDDYLAGRLSEDETDAFEERMLTDTGLQKEVREQISFRDALKAESGLLLAEPEAGFLSRVVGAIQSPVWAYSATAGLVLAVGVGLLNSGSPETGLMGQGAVIRNVEMTRSGTENVIRVPGGQALVLSIDAYGLGVSRAGLKIASDSQLLVNIPELRADEQELFNVVVGPLSVGEYRMEIIREDAEPMVSVLIVE